MISTGYVREGPVCCALLMRIAQTRILVPSASVPSVSGTSSLWRRKSSVGAVDAQGLGLTHPMTWLDERLFGWSSSARRGTSAWSGASGDETSRMPTPDGSDNEDAGDYDDVAGLVDDHHLAAMKSRSRNSSFADLQRLRMSGLSSGKPSPAASSTAIADQNQSLRQTAGSGHRTRRASLTHDVPVERISHLDRRESFDEATHDLNEENSRSKTR